MKLVLASCCWLTLAHSQILQPLDFDWKELKPISESPEFEPALNFIDQNLIRDSTTSTSANLSSRIVGGKFSNAGQFPHHVQLILDSKYLCGGSLIDAKWILTVFHTGIKT